MRKVLQEKLQEDLLASKLETQRIQVWFWDETGFSLRVVRRKTWGRKGKRKLVTGPRRRGRVNVMGGVKYHERKRICFFNQKANGKSFYEQLERLNEAIKKEWVLAGPAAEFQELGPKLLRILDNASSHKKPEILEKIEKQLSNIQLEFLPAYSPDFNLVELVWHSAKEYIADKLFKSVTELKELLERLLNQGELMIEWGRKVKNKGNVAIAS